MGLVPAGEKPGSATKSLFLVLPGQCFSIRELKPWLDCTFILSECSFTVVGETHHQLKMVMMLGSLREYANTLRAAGAHVCYYPLDGLEGDTFLEQMTRAMKETGGKDLIHFEIEDQPAAQEVSDCTNHLGLKTTILPSPIFLCSREGFADYLAKESRPRMVSFYRQQRVRLGMLVDENGAPTGGQWSLDAENRRPLAKEVEPPSPRFPRPSESTQQVMRLVAERFPTYPGDASRFQYPVNHRQAKHWLDSFIKERLNLFGDFEDALTTRSDVVFHSLISPLMNFGLLDPRQVLTAVFKFHQKNLVPLNSLEGFVRQVIGWREFVRGIYHNFGDEQQNGNFFNHSSGLTDDWYKGTTGIDPLDHVIQKTQSMGWAHHIERLMVVGNLMNLARIHPQAVHQWFMEMYVDSAHWVMGPNVYGMALFSDGGIFATKPYICASSYIRKMGDYGKGDWCDVVDGLYWRFVHDHQAYLAKNHRTAMMPRNLARLKADRRETIFSAADDFLKRKTVIPTV